MKHARTRLALESLDDRIVPAVVSPNPSPPAAASAAIAAWAGYGTGPGFFSPATAAVPATPGVSAPNVVQAGTPGYLAYMLGMSAGNTANATGHLAAAEELAAGGSGAGYVAIGQALDDAGPSHDTGSLSLATAGSGPSRGPGVSGAGPAASAPLGSGVRTLEGRPGDDTRVVNLPSDSNAPDMGVSLMDLRPGGYGPTPGPEARVQPGDWWVADEDAEFSWHVSTLAPDDEDSRDAPNPSLFRIFWGEVNDGLVRTGNGLLGAGVEFGQVTRDLVNTDLSARSQVANYLFGTPVYGYDLHSRTFSGYDQAVKSSAPPGPGRYQSPEAARVQFQAMRGAATLGLYDLGAVFTRRIGLATTVSTRRAPAGSRSGPSCLTARKSWGESLGRRART